MTLYNYVLNKIIKKNKKYIEFCIIYWLSNKPSTPLHISYDVWIDASSVVLPGCKHIGKGVIIGAGSIV